jgi:hypothetical protein
MYDVFCLSYCISSLLWLLLLLLLFFFFLLLLQGLLLFQRHVDLCIADNVTFEMRRNMFSVLSKGQ